MSTSEFAIRLSGSLIEARSREAVGMLSVSGTIGSVIANADATDSKRVFEGISGNIVADSINRIDIGEGLAAQGTGSYSFAGIYAGAAAAAGTSTNSGKINFITGNNADLSGVIYASNQIQTISINNGSLIGARILVATGVDQASFLQRGFTLTDTQTETVPTTGTGTARPAPIHYSIGRINIINGGILGSQILGGDFNTISVSKGFGIFSSSLRFVAQFNSNGAVITDGMGIRDTTISAGASLNIIEAKGMGEVLDARSWGNRILQSERRRFDANTGRLLNATYDLHRYLGTSRSNSKISGITNAGLIEDSIIQGSADLGSVNAYMIRARSPDVAPSSGSFPMRITFANSTNKITATSAISGLGLSTGRINQLSSGGNMERTSVQVAGRAKVIAVGGNLRGSSTINVSGPEGFLDRLFVRRGMFGTVNVKRTIGSLEFGSQGGSVQGSENITNVRVTGDVLTGSFTRAARTIGTLFVGGDVQSGAVIQARNIGTTTIVGSDLRD